MEKHFDTAFAAPHGIAKLRELILTLAMQGKLVEQDSNDPPASEILKEIEAEKQRLVKAGIFRNNDDKLSNGSICPFELPQMWEWASVQQLGFVLGGKRLPKGHAYSEAPTNYRYLTVTNMKNATIIDNDVKYIAQETHEEIKKYVISRDDIYITIAGTIGVVGTIPEHCDGMNLTENASRLVFFGCDKLFLVHLLNSRIVQNQFAVLTNKMAQPKLSLRSILSTGVPIPPLPEQHRIVARIDQLMARCDELEKLSKEREEKRLAVHTAAIKQLLDAPDGSAWDFIQQHFGELYTVKENVAELRKAILQLAVMGCLVPQDAGDPPASELLKEIEAEKQRLVKAGKIKKPKPLPPINSEKVPYELPQGWEWVRLGDILIFGPTNGFSPRAVEYETAVRSLTLSATTTGVFKEEHSKYIVNDIPYDSELWLRAGDILVQRGNTLEYVGVSAVYQGEPNRFIYPDLMMKIRVAAKVDVNYSHRAMSSQFSRDYMRARASGTSGTMPKINQMTLRSLPLPLPSLQEQHRIVAKIDQLMALCDSLDQQIDAASGKQSELLRAVMAQV